MCWAISLGTYGLWVEPWIAKQYNGAATNLVWIRAHELWSASDSAAVLVF